MSILPQFADVDLLAGLPGDSAERVRAGKNPVFDFAQGEFVRTASGRLAEVTGQESLKVWVQKALLTARSRFLIYTDQYGNEAFELIGVQVSDEILFMELERLITETLVYDKRVSACSGFQFQRAGDRVLCEFTLVTPLGAEQMTFTLGGEQG